MKILSRQLQAPNIVRLFHQYYENTTATMRDGSVKFDIGSGVRQGCEESPLLFVIFFDFVLTVIEERIFQQFGDDAGLKFSFNIQNESNVRKSGPLSSASGSAQFLKLLYADDLVILEDNGSISG